MAFEKRLDKWRSSMSHPAMWRASSQGNSKVMLPSMVAQTTWPSNFLDDHPTHTRPATDPSGRRTRPGVLLVRGVQDASSSEAPGSPARRDDLLICSSQWTSAPFQRSFSLPNQPEYSINPSNTLRTSSNKV